MNARDGRPVSIELIYGGERTRYELAGRPEWECDPCAPSHRRWRVRIGLNDTWQEYPWFRIVTPLDSPRDIDVKHAAADAAGCLWEQKRELERQLRAMGAIA